jgi:hypothetical protein
MTERNRRWILSDIGVGAAIVAMRAGAGFAATPSTLRTAVNFDVPRGRCDCHVHVFDPTRVPYSPNRPFTPPPATIEDLSELLRERRLDRVVIVAPGDNFTSNSFILDAVRQLGPGARRCGEAHRAKGLRPKLRIPTGLCAGRRTGSCRNGGGTRD